MWSDECGERPVKIDSPCIVDYVGYFLIEEPICGRIKAQEGVGEVAREECYC